MLAAIDAGIAAYYWTSTRYPMVGNDWFYAMDGTKELGLSNKLQACSCAKSCVIADSASFFSSSVSAVTTVARKEV